MTSRKVTCRYLKRHEVCSAEAVDPTAETLLCAKHIAGALAAIKTARLAAFGEDGLAKLEQQAQEAAERKEMEKYGAVVYYAEAWGHIKIGTTLNVEARMVDLKATCLATEPGSYDVEKQRHHQFAHIRAIGEYFHPSDDLTAHMEAIRGQHGPAITTHAQQLLLARQRRQAAERAALDAARLGKERLAAALWPKR